MPAYCGSLSCVPRHPAMGLVGPFLRMHLSRMPSCLTMWPTGCFACERSGRVTFGFTPAASSAAVFSDVPQRAGCMSTSQAETRQVLLQEP